MLRDLTFSGPANMPRIFSSTTAQSEVAINASNDYGGATCAVMKRLPPGDPFCSE